MISSFCGCLFCSEELGNHIKQKVIEAEAAQSKSKHLLEAAKRAVETAIERNEQTALEMISAETSSEA